MTKTSRIELGRHATIEKLKCLCTGFIENDRIRVVVVISRLATTLVGCNFVHRIINTSLLCKKFAALVACGQPMIIVKALSCHDVESFKEGVFLGDNRCRTRK